MAVAAVFREQKSRRRRLTRGRANSVPLDVAGRLFVFCKRLPRFYYSLRHWRAPSIFPPRTGGRSTIFCAHTPPAILYKSITARRHLAHTHSILADFETAAPLIRTNYNDDRGLLCVHGSRRFAITDRPATLLNTRNWDFFERGWEENHHLTNCSRISRRSTTSNSGCCFHGLPSPIFVCNTEL